MSRPLHRPSIERLAEPLRSVVRELAERLAEAGHRAWLVGGAVRDLALGRTPKEADLSSAARPEEVERLFEHTLPVGKHFGTILVQLRGIEVQVTTFRSEQGYSDARRPDEVAFGTSLDEDAARRDFTCNALYLDPLTDEFRDPVGGLGDLGAGRLCCVGDPARRFAEDGLRLLRLARLAAALDLAVEPETLEAARANVARLAGVSAERIRAELELIAEGLDPARAVQILARADALRRILPLAEAQEQDALLALTRLGEAPGLALMLAVLLGPLEAVDRSRALEAVLALRPSRELLRRLQEIWRLEAEIRTVLDQRAPASRSSRIRLVREKEWPAALRVFRARFPDVLELDELERFAGSLTRQEVHPVPLLSSADLAQIGLEPGPEWGAILREAEGLQLDGSHATREEALSWLRSRAAGLAQDGGNARRNKKLSG